MDNFIVTAIWRDKKINLLDENDKVISSCNIDECIYNIKCVGDKFIYVITIDGYGIYKLEYKSEFKISNLPYKIHDDVDWLHNSTIGCCRNFLNNEIDIIDLTNGIDQRQIEINCKRFRHYNSGRCRMINENLIAINFMNKKCKFIDKAVVINHDGKHVNTLYGDVSNLYTISSEYFLIMKNTYIEIYKINGTSIKKFQNIDIVGSYFSYAIWSKYEMILKGTHKVHVLNFIDDKFVINERPRVPELCINNVRKDYLLTYKNSSRVKEYQSRLYETLMNIGITKCLHLVIFDYIAYYG